MHLHRLILAVLFLVFGLLSILPIIWNEANVGLDLDFVNIQYSASSLPVWEKVLFSLIPLVALGGSTLLFRNSDKSKWCSLWGRPFPYTISGIWEEARNETSCSSRPTLMPVAQRHPYLSRRFTETSPGSFKPPVIRFPRSVRSDLRSIASWKEEP